MNHSADRLGKVKRLPADAASAADAGTLRARRPTQAFCGRLSAENRKRALDSGALPTRDSTRTPVADGGLPPRARSHASMVRALFLRFPRSARFARAAAPMWIPLLVVLAP